MDNYFVNDWCEKRFYSALKTNSLFCKMFFDESFTDAAAEDDVKALISFLYRYNAPIKTVMKIRDKYRVQLANETSGIQGAINRYGLRSPEHIVKYVSSNTRMLTINGYSEAEWKYLTAEDLSIFRKTPVTHFINKSIRTGDTAAYEMLTTKYGTQLEEYERNRAAKILLEHNLPPDTKYSQLDSLHIDGVSFNCWRLLHDDEYQPSKPILVSNHTFLKRCCRNDDMTFIEDKYHEILFPKREEFFTEREKAEASYFFAHIHN